MTFLATFFRFILVLTLIVFIGYFGARELLLYFAGNQVVRAGRFLTQPVHYQPAISRCLSGEEPGKTATALQLRFLDDRSYVVEVVCLGGTDQEVGRGSLPWRVRKTTGSAGFWYGLETKNFVGELTLELWGQHRVVFVEGDSLRQTWGKTVLRSSVPESVCVAHGLQCCDAVLQQGEGEKQSQGVSDCQGQCYPQCLRRPLLLSFETDPRYEYETRTLRVTPGAAQVGFFYSFEEQEAKVTQVIIDYGDGQTETETVADGQFIHEYTCSQSSCQYTATIRATDSRGLSSPDTRISHVIVLVAP